MKLRNFLYENSTSLRNKIMKWTFGRHNYEIRIVSRTHVDYRAVGGGWRSIAISMLIDDTISDIKVTKPRIVSSSVVCIVTQG